MTIISVNWGDVDSRPRHILYDNLPGANVVEITPDMIDTYEDIVDNALANEDDTLIMCGHGTAQGLLFPNLASGIYLVHDLNCHLIHARRVVCIWCNASGFAIRHPELNAFFTSMFITNMNEAYDNAIYEVTQEEISASQSLFYHRVRELIDNNIPLDQWVMNLGARIDIENPVETFNYQGLYYQ